MSDVIWEGLQDSPELREELGRMGAAIVGRRPEQYAAEYLHRMQHGDPEKRRVSACLLTWLHLRPWPDSAPLLEAAAPDRAPFRDAYAASFYEIWIREVTSAIRSYWQAFFDRHGPRKQDWSPRKSRRSASIRKVT